MNIELLKNKISNILNIQKERIKILYEIENIIVNKINLNNNNQYVVAINNNILKIYNYNEFQNYKNKNSNNIINNIIIFQDIICNYNINNDELLKYYEKI